MFSFLIFFLILSILVLVHEFGHFIAAKKNGVCVEEFGIGLPPRIFGIKIKETLYTINWLPFGGFVKLFGEEYHQIIKTKSFLKKAFVNKKPLQKAIIISAGVFMNILLGIVIFYIILGLNGFKSDPFPIFLEPNFKFGSVEKKVLVISVNKDSPASKAGIQPEDIVFRYKINNSNWINIYNSSQFIDAVKNLGEKEIVFDILNNKNGERKIIKTIPVYNNQLKRYIIGVTLVDGIVLKYETSIEKLFSGFFHSYNLTDYNIRILVKLFSSAIKEKRAETVTQAFSGPIGIFAIVKETVESSGRKMVFNLLNLTAILSLTLALINIFPFPALDGGRLVLVIYEGLFKKKPNPEIEKNLNLIGFIILLSLIILITINDISKYSILKLFNFK